ncbi:MAG: outer membrane beta-barrel protein [Bacteroidia bacterium]
MIRYKTILLLVLTTAGIYANVHAQSDPCIVKMKDAAQQYEEGWYDESIGTIKQVLRTCELEKGDKLNAYKILIINYLAIDNLEGANSGAASIMKLSPNYEPDKLRDPFEYVKLFDNYRPTPILNLRVSGGTNFNRFSVVNTYSIVGNPAQLDLENYESNYGFQTAIELELRLLRGLWVSGGIQLRQSSYTHYIENVEERTINYEERLSYFEIPLGVRYYFIQRHLQPFAEVGLANSFVRSSLAQLSRDNIIDLIDRMPERNKHQFAPIFKAGFSYRKKAVKMQVYASYMVLPQLINIPENRYNNLTAVFRYYYLDNDVKLDNFQIGAAISYSLFYKNLLFR